MKTLFIFCLIAPLLFSCEKSIPITIKSSSPKLVVDGNIENGKSPQIILTNTVAYFDGLNGSVLEKAFVHNAVVMVSNGVVTQQLKEYGYTIPGGFKVFVYQNDSINNDTAFKGLLNTTYYLTVITAGKTYTATTKIPALAKTVDSLYWRPAPFLGYPNDISLFAKFTDPQGLGNYTRYFVQKNNKQFLPGANSVFDDQLTDGTTYEQLVYPGEDRNAIAPFDIYYFKRGDSITYKLCNIDKGTYHFWNSWEFAYQSLGNPFAQPNKVIGNISNGALGAFYGYAAMYKTLIVPQ